MPSEASIYKSPAVSRHPGVTAETRKIRRDHCWGIRQGWRKIGEEKGLSELMEEMEKAGWGFS